MAFSKNFFFATFPNVACLCLLKMGAGIDSLKSMPHFVPCWWWVLPKKFSCSMLVPTTTQGMSIVLSLKLCLFIQFRALELLLDLLNPAFGSIFGKPELDFPLIQVCFGLFSLVGWGQVQHACPHHHTRALEFCFWIC